MKSIDLAAFCAQLGAVYARKDETGFTRVWGYIIHNKEYVLTFWRHRQRMTFSFMHLESYVIPTSLAAKEEEKLGRGYLAVDLAETRFKSTLRTLRRDYLAAVDEGDFHYTPQQSVG